ncbi:PREDICTED: uncharacterized protein LOC109166282 [Ipomoea nil]|uniref:uncharacterized protein LOC109166282 n=1 Tax=Ipomoea nil TaxID=35883 RepID=UPI000901DC5C|nr:PREDICTED: uncharacterized protein LOC109166282 [Ipomoea nil]
MADPVRNIIIKLGSKVHPPTAALKHIQTLLQLAMKKKLKLDPLLRDEILVTVMTNYPEFYAEWSADDVIELLVLVAEASDDVSPVFTPEPSDGNRVGAFLQFFAQRALESVEEARRREESQALEDDKILAEVYGSQAPSSAAPTVEATAHPDSTNFRIREISNIVGSSSANVSDSSHSPVKKRKSSETAKPEGDLPIHQVFKTLRSSVKQQGTTAAQATSAPAPSARKGKPTTRSRGRSVTPEVPPIERIDTTVYKPQFVSPAAQTKWATMVRRELIVQRTVDENQLNSVCDILPLLNEVSLLKTVTDVCPYSKLLTYEFYSNLSDEIDSLTGPRPMQIFIRGKWYDFGPDVINKYYGLPTVQEEAVTEWDGYVILHRLALHNWLPSAHFNTVSKLLAGFLFRIGTKMKCDLGKWIFYHVLTLIHPREQKGLKPMPSEVISPMLLYTVDKRLLSGDYIKDVVPVTAPSNSEPDAVNDESPHAKDVKLSEQLKTQVTDLETVHGIIAKQLTGARIELATVLLRMSLSDTAAAAEDPVKSDYDSPSNA